MIVVEVKDGESLDRALRRYKKKYERLGIMKKMRNRKYHTTRGDERRKQVKKARRRDQYLREHGQ